ncbi:MAG: YfiR/HmsC family protein [Flavobacteriales bacterium]|nr:YfiR/HmsC family protein [Flavobacteriales bacterium]
MKRALLFTLSILSFTLAFSQEENRTARAEFLVRFTKSKFIEWPKSSRRNFDFTILSDSLLFEEVKKLSGKKTIFGKSLNVSLSKSLESVADGVDMLYVHASDGIPMDVLLKKYDKKPVLIVGENYPYHSCMINLLTLNGKTVYEINTSLLEKSGLKALPALIEGQSNDELLWKKNAEEAKQQLEKEKSLLRKNEAELKKAKGLISEMDEIISSTDSALQSTSDTLEQAKNEISQKNEILTKKEHEIQMQEVENSAQRKITIAIVIVLVLVLAFAIFIFVSFRNSKRVNQQLGQLNKQLKKHKDDLFLQKITIEHKNREIEDSINYARRIQDALMPSPHLLRNYFADNFILYLPKSIVSGDFFWFHQTEKQAMVAVVDCTGHGVPGAMMSVIGLKLLNEAVNEKKLIHPSEIVEHIDQGVAEAFRQNAQMNIRDGMDLSIISIDTSTRKLEFAGVYNPLYIVNESGLRELKADKKAIGSITGDFRYTNQTLQLNAGDSIYLFTDGYADQFGGSGGKKFKYAQLRQLLKDNFNRNMTDQEKIIRNTFESWRGQLEQVDDICMVGIRIH